MTSQGGHSARENTVAGRRSHGSRGSDGPGFSAGDHASESAAGNACVLMQVDGGERYWNVRLPAGLSAATRRVPILAVR